jgi:hypothetical protein
MPTSNLALWPAILDLVWQVHPERVLDVGPGHGKAGVLLREYCGTEIVDAVEAWEPYVTPRLRAIYDSVWTGDVMDFPPASLDGYDLVLLVDVIEHLSREDGFELLHRIPERVVVCTPAEFFQNPEHEDCPPEKHRSLWSLTDFGDRVEADASALGGVLVRLGPRSEGRNARWD